MRYGVVLIWIASVFRRLFYKNQYKMINIKLVCEAVLESL
jgi:hypothetical protein